MITLKQLRALVDAQPKEHDGREVRIWLPGSKIGLEFNGGKMIDDGHALMIEGNLMARSVLGRSRET